ncbi:MAG: peptidylprolyl isomerase [Thaumarchaeota archaeon]|nr:peptidylprolyl isomerase [Nitrososphaerota archaeon]
MTNSSSTTAGDTAVITTKYGDITLKLYNDVAPKTVANFEKLANSGFYDGTLFHRIVPGFVIQGGDPNTKNGTQDTWGMGDAGYTIPPEFSDMNFSKYTVGMARGQDVNSGSSQFFITVGDASFLDGKYTLFGQVVSGQDIVDKITSLPTNAQSQPVNPDDARIISIKTSPSIPTK